MPQFCKCSRALNSNGKCRDCDEAAVYRSLRRIGKEPVSLGVPVADTRGMHGRDAERLQHQRAYQKRKNKKFLKQQLDPD